VADDGSPATAADGLIARAEGARQTQIATPTSIKTPTAITATNMFGLISCFMRC
jgi:hypothetical protein